jgi:hypothetical protein
MAWFLPTVNSNHADNEFGPGICTTPSLELALRYAEVQGALIVFYNPDFQNVNVWQPSQEDWATIVTYWSGTPKLRTDMNVFVKKDAPLDSLLVNGEACVSCAHLLKTLLT